MNQKQLQELKAIHSVIGTIVKNRHDPTLRDLWVRLRKLIESTTIEAPTVKEPTVAAQSKRGIGAMRRLAQEMT